MTIYRICAFVLLAVITEVGSTDEICKQSIDTLPCNILYEVIEKDGMFSIRKETLDNNCTQLLGSFRCLKNYWTKCSPQSLEYLLLYMSGVKWIIQQLCNPKSNVRKEYDEHITCLMHSSEALRNCTHVAEQKVRILRKDNPNLHFLSASAIRCLAHIELVGCVRSVAGHHCGSDAGQMLGGLVEMSVRPYRYLKCYTLEHLEEASDEKEYEKSMFK